MASRQNPIDSDYVRELAALIAATDLSEIEVQKGDLRIRVARTITASVSVPVPAPVHAQSPAPAPALASSPVAPAPTPKEHPGAVPSPMVGTAYLRASPGAKAFVEVGSQIAAGERILLVEAMKTFNDIVAPRSGTITAILVEDGQPVEYGEPLMIIE